MDAGCFGTEQRGDQSNQQEHDPEDNQRQLNKTNTYEIEGVLNWGPVGHWSEEVLFELEDC